MRRVIIAGSRIPEQYRKLREAREDWYQRVLPWAEVEIMEILGWKDSMFYTRPEIEVVCGMANGFDEIGRRWATTRSVPVKEMPANWATYGASAGAVRNQQMLDFSLPDGLLIAFWDQRSNGTDNMIKLANKRLESYIIDVSGKFGYDHVS